ncbi:MAG: hypothetical protein C3F02_04530 [Parcubacteria group bacterium]|nr:MAG: hypothetical protein C3F02_04530 [Parcubacteria group bacterium]
MKIIFGIDNDNQERILHEMGVDFIVRPTNFVEHPVHYGDPSQQALAMAKAKAQRLDNDLNEPVVILTTAQVVTYEEHFLHKPKNEAEARKLLDSYHRLPAKCYTAVVAINAQSSQEAEGVELAKVYFNPLSKDEIDHLIKTGDVYNLEGGFNIRGAEWRRHIRTIDGHQDTVLGLPKELARRLIEQVQGQL